jgi:hypothetical protein
MISVYHNESLKEVSYDSAVIISVSENTRELEKLIRSKNVFYYMLRPFNLKELWDAVESGARQFVKLRLLRNSNDISLHQKRGTMEKIRK